VTIGISSYQAANLDKYVIEEDDVILAMDRPVVGGKLKFSWAKSGDPKSLLVQRMARLRGTENLDGVFLRYVIGSPEFSNYVDSITTGANVPHISGPDIKGYSFWLPELAKQKRIGEVLSAYDNLIDNNLKRIKLLEEIVKITYDEWFVRMKFPGHDTEQFACSTQLPKGWKRSVLGDFLSYAKRGISPQYVESNGATVINQKCIRDHHINIDASRQTSLSKKIADDKILRKYDILVNSTGTGTLGRVAQWFFESDDIVTVDTHVTIVRANRGMSPLYLGRFIEKNEPIIESLGKGATNQKELSANDLSSQIEIVVPDKQVQAAFDSLCDPIFEQITNLFKQNIFLKEARDILLPRLMTGVVDVEHLYTEQGLMEAA